MVIVLLIILSFISTFTSSDGNPAGPYPYRAHLTFTQPNLTSNKQQKHISIIKKMFVVHFQYEGYHTHLPILRVYKSLNSNKLFLIVKLLLYNYICPSVIC